MAVRKLYAGLLVLAVVALGAASLGAAFVLQKQAADQVIVGDALGTVTFEPSAADAPEAREGKLVLVTKRRGSPGDGNMALMEAIEDHCPDGRSFSTWDTEPKGPFTAEEWEAASQPAGTRFTQSIRCDGPLPNEMAIAAGTAPEKAQEQVLAALEDGGDTAGGEFTVNPVSYYESLPKYHAFDRTLGALVRSFANRRCPDGQTVVRRIVVGTLPAGIAVQKGAMPSSQFLLGTSMACLSASDPAGRPE